MQKTWCTAYLVMPPHWRPWSGAPLRRSCAPGWRLRPAVLAASQGACWTLSQRRLPRSQAAAVSLFICLKTHDAMKSRRKVVTCCLQSPTALSAGMLMGGVVGQPGFKK